jgi:hypothetical protein
MTVNSRNLQVITSRAARDGARERVCFAQKPIAATKMATWRISRPQSLIAIIEQFGARASVPTFDPTSARVLEAAAAARASGPGGGVALELGPGPARERVSIARAGQGPGARRGPQRYPGRYPAVGRVG